MDPVNNFHDFVTMVYGNKRPIKLGPLDKMLGIKDEYYIRKQQEMVKDCMDMMTFPPIVVSAPCSLEPCKKSQLDFIKKEGCPAPAQKQEEDMNSYATAATINVADNAEKDQRRYLERRLSDIFYSKKNTAKKQFGLVNDDAPRTFEDLKARLDAGKYVIDEKDAKKKDWNNGLSYVEWRDPSVKQDQEGYDAWKKAAKAELTRIEDSIKIDAPADALKAVQAFEDAPIA